MRRALILAVATALALAPSPAAAEDEQGPMQGPDTLYGPDARKKARAKGLVDRLDGGPDPKVSPSWFADQTWSAAGFRLVGAPRLEVCDDQDRVSNDVWTTKLERGRQHAAAGEWKAVRTELEALLARPDCVQGLLGPRSELHGAYLDLARAEWLGYPQDATFALSILDSAVTLAPDRGWPYSAEVELETAYWEAREALVHLPRARLLIIDPDHRISVDGQTADPRRAQEPAPAERWVELVPGPHLVQIAGDPVTTGVLVAAPGARLVLGSTSALWDTLSDLSKGEDTRPEPAFARAALHQTHPGGYWLVTKGRAAKVASDGTFAWPWYSLRFLTGASLGYRFHQRDTQAPDVVSEAPTAHWLEPRVMVGIRGRQKYGAPALAMVASASLMLSRPFDLGALGTHMRGIPTVRVGPTLGMAGGLVRITGMLYAEALFVGPQVVKRDTNGVIDIVTVPTVFLGVGAEVQAALRLTRFMWLTLEGGGGWTASPTVRASLGLELRVWAERH